MAAIARDKEPMLSTSNVPEQDDTYDRRFTTRNRSASFSVTMNSINSFGNGGNRIGQTGSSNNERRNQFSPMSGPIFVHPKNENLLLTSQGVKERKTAGSRVRNYSLPRGMIQNNLAGNSLANKNEHLLKSGPLGMCNDPYCTTCPTSHKFKGQYKSHKAPTVQDHKFHNVLREDPKGWAKRICSLLYGNMPGVMNPHAKLVQKWNKFFVISCLVAIFLDPLFFLLLSAQQDNKCIVINWTMTTTLAVLRSITDFICLINMLLQFRLAYIAPESMVVGAGDLVDHPKKIALHYLSGYFLIDLFVVLPLPQIIILLILPNSLGSSGANYAKNLLRAAILVQYIPRLCRFLPLLAGQTPTGILFESAWANFILNLLSFLLSAHVVGSFWYLFGLQRVNQCLRDACRSTGIPNCVKFIDCGYGNRYQQFETDSTWNDWKNSDNATACFGQGGFSYGIYANAVDLTAESSFITRYIYSLFWGFQQISTLAGNQIPSYFVWEVLFTMAIIGLGLLLFALLIGNMQNFLQALGRRRSEMSLRRRDVEMWMNHRRFPEELKRQVRESERYNWAASRGVNEAKLMENLPEDLQKEIRRHLFKFIKNVRIFSVMDEPILDSMCEKLKHSIYVKGSKILYPGGLIDKMVFIVRGKVESIGEDGDTVLLSEGGVCGEELLTWCLEHSSVNRDVKMNRIPGHRLPSNRTVRCLTNVEAFILRAVDLEEVTSLFTRFLRNPRVHGAIRYASPYWRSLAAIRIQVAWRYRMKRLGRAESVPQSYHS